MGEIFPAILVIMCLLAIIGAFAWKSTRLKTASEQDVVTRFKVNFSRAKAKEIATAMTNAANGKDVAPVVEFYEEGTNRLIRFELNS